MAVTQKNIDGIKEFIQHQVEDARTSGVVIGLSGGIDSALTAKLCVDALGKENVYCVNLPCKSNPNDEVDAKLVADWLGLPMRRIDLGPAFEQMAITMDEPVENGQPSAKTLTLANMKSRLRMIALYAIANEHNLLVAGTTNKSEVLLGYATKYGDGGVDIEPIQDFLKTEVWEMSSMLGVPQKIIDRIPTAGLWDGQTDESELGMSYYDIDAVLRNAVLSYNHASDELNHFPDRIEAINKIKDLIDRNRHKGKIPPFYKRRDDYDKFMNFD